MKAIAGHKGNIVIVEREEPILLPGHVRIRTEYSAISPGTELSMLSKALEQQVTLGYSAVGIVEEIGLNVTGIQPGDRVACYGAPYVCHAEQLVVPTNLTCLVPDHVASEEAAFAGLGAIAIHALRTADLRFGETAVVLGLGILGNLIAQIAHAAAIQTLGMDVSRERIAMLQGRGLPSVYEKSEELEEQLGVLTGGRGADAVLLCISGPGEEVINRAFTWIRDRGKMVVVGDISTEFSRSAMFAKEAQVLISRAGGPGRYDSQYERENKDYPLGYVRWTEGRNIGEYIRLLADHRISVKPLITDCYPLENANAAYEQYRSPGKAVGTIIKYG